MNNNKKGNATVYLVIIAIIALLVTFLVVRLDWRRFKAEAGFVFAMVLIVIAILLVIILMIRHIIKKSRKEKEARKAAKEQEKLEKEKHE